MDDSIYSLLCVNLALQGGRSSRQAAERADADRKHRIDRKRKKRTKKATQRKNR